MRSGTGDPVWRLNLPDRRVAIIAALEIEAAIPRKTTHGVNPVYVSGPGDARAYASARRALAEGATALIAFGLAGGLGPGAKTACIVLPGIVQSAAGQWNTDPDWRASLAEALAAGFCLVDGPLYSADHVVTTPAGKSALAARSGAVAVDMESAAVGRAAAEAGMPFVALRAIADNAGDTLPPDIELLVTDDGRTNYRKLARFVFSPSRLAMLIRLARRSGLARRELGRVVRFLARPSSQ